MDIVTRRHATEKFDEPIPIQTVVPEEDHGVVSRLNPPLPERTDQTARFISFATGEHMNICVTVDVIKCGPIVASW